VNSVEFFALRACVDDGIDRPSAQTGGDALERVTRGDLRLPPSVRETADADASLPPNRDAFGFQPFEARDIDWFKRQAVLKSGFARSLELARRFD